MSTELTAAASPFGNIAEHVEKSLRLSQQQGLLTDNLSPNYMELARARRLYAANTGAGTAIAPVAAIPTTAAAWALYNGHTTRMVVPIMVTCHSVSGTLGLGMSLLAGLSGTKQASALTAYASSVSKPITPGSAASGGVFAQGATLAEAPAWITLASRDQVSAVSVGSGLTGFPDGLFVIPPLYALGATVLAPLGTTALFNVGFVWAELDMTLS